MAAPWEALLTGREESPVWLRLLKAMAQQGDPNARALLDHLGRLHAFDPRAEDPEAVAACLQATTADVLKLLERLPPDFDRVSGIQFWSSQLNRFLEERGFHLRVRKLFPGDRFDHATMLAESSQSGHNLMVHAVLSWMVAAVEPATPRILERARVITT